jgi:endonuclease/exonuclease/phosphatase family metal-dependent hydrolase
LAKLDRIFVSTDWEVGFPLVKITALPNNISDHNPLLVDSGTNFVL